jgi:tRNA pseudouridine65 synthase/23S rRNA pseudouridine1911/1915/1917 synthase
LKFSNLFTIKIIKTHIVSIINLTTRLNTYCEKIEILPSRKGIKKAISKGEILLNHKKVEGGRFLKQGDIIELVDLENTLPKTYHLRLSVIYEDDYIAVIKKPAGINVSGNKFKTVQNALMFNLNKSTQIDALPWALPVHRLDNQTQGLLMIAKTKTARVKLGQAFENKSIKKTYQAVVIGKPKKQDTIKLTIDGKHSITYYNLLKTVNSLKNGFLSLIELCPQTGRTHQLRIHCSKSGFPILGDKLYGKEGLILKHKGLFLCATELKFNHPITMVPLCFSIKTPHKFIQRLDNEERRYNQNKLF